MSFPDPPSTAPVALSDYERLAHEILDPRAHAYAAGGAGDELTVAANLAAWREPELLPRVLRAVGTRDPSATVLGRQLPHPVIIAPMAFQRLAHREGELAMARGAAQTGTVMCLSTLATASAAEVAAAAPDAERWFQLYVYRDRGVAWELIARARESGYTALVITADLPVMGVRERELRYPAEAPAQIVPNARGLDAGTPEAFTAEIDPDLSWSDIERFAADSGLPVLVKGVLSPKDAILAAEHGAGGVVVSNHGGRQLDTAIASARALPAVVEAAGGRLDVLVDGGIRRGTDVAKALALGASAVMVGRPLLWGLAVGGAEGVSHVLELLLSEFDRSLALLGVPRARDLDRAVLAP